MSMSERKIDQQLEDNNFLVLLSRGYLHLLGFSLKIKSARECFARIKKF